MFKVFSEDLMKEVIVYGVENRNPNLTVFLIYNPNNSKYERWQWLPSCRFTPIDEYEKIIKNESKSSDYIHTVM